MPEELHSQTGYVTKFGPLVTQGNEAYVHHLVVTLCTGVNESHVGNGGDCGSEEIAFEVKNCRSGTALAAWAVGGELFVYPENVAYPFGGEGYIMIELHYDNPKEVEGTLDSSGMRIWYTKTPREHDAGILTVGHLVTPLQVIPPNSKNFVNIGLMPAECTNEYLPDDGIHVFGNFFHTHLAGHGLTFQHFRYNSECGVYEELEPIDENLKYDFDYQQFTHLKREVIIKPGDILQVKCFYKTEGLDGVTLGGLGTRDEMCLSSVVYYPRQDVVFSASQLTQTEYFKFLGTTPSGQQILSEEVEYVDGLNAIDWDSMRNTFQATLDNGTYDVYCGIDEQRLNYYTKKVMKSECPYIPPDQCTGNTPPTCCERIVEDAGVVLRASMALLLALSLLTAILA
jgi:hypothetical protein